MEVLLLYCINVLEYGKSPWSKIYVLENINMQVTVTSFLNGHCFGRCLALPSNPFELLS